MWFWESDTVSYAGGNNTRVPGKKPDKRTESEDAIWPVDAASTAALLLQGQVTPAECVGNTHFCAQERGRGKKKIGNRFCVQYTGRRTKEMFVASDASVLLV